MLKERPAYFEELLHTCRGLVVEHLRERVQKRAQFRRVCFLNVDGIGDCAKIIDESWLERYLLLLETIDLFLNLELLIYRDTSPRAGKTGTDDGRIDTSGVFEDDSHTIWEPYRGRGLILRPNQGRKQQQKQEIWLSGIHKN